MLDDAVLTRMKNFTCTGSYDVTVVRHFTQDAINSGGQLGLVEYLENKTFHIKDSKNSRLQRIEPGQFTFVSSCSNTVIIRLENSL